MIIFIWKIVSIKLESKHINKNNHIITLCSTEQLHFYDFFSPRNENPPSVSPFDSYQTQPYILDNNFLCQILTKLNHYCGLLRTNTSSPKRQFLIKLWEVFDWMICNSPVWRTCVFSLSLSHTHTQIFCWLRMKINFIY